MSLTGQVIAITGTLSKPRKKIIEIITSNGGKFASSLTKNVTHLICADISAGGTKYDKAVKQGVTIVTEDHLKNLASSASAGETSKKRASKTEQVSVVPTKKQKTSNGSTRASSTEVPKIITTMNSFLEDMKKSNSNLDKGVVFKQYILGDDICNEFIELLKIIYTKQLKFGVTSKNILKFEKDKFNKDTDYVQMDLLEFTKKLVASELTGHSALKVAVSFLLGYPDYREMLLLVFDKDLKIRFGLKQANKVVPDFVPEFSVSLGQSYNDKTKSLVDKGEWYMSKKLDGVRCITIIKPDKRDNPKIEFYSRQGLKLLTLDKVDSHIKSIWTEFSKVLTKLGMNRDNGGGYVLDGEMCIVKEDGNEDFRLIMKEIRRKKHTVGNPRYYVFDLLTLKEFSEGKSEQNRKFSDRLKVMTKVLPAVDFEKNEAPDKTILVIPQLLFTEAGFSKMSKQAEDKGWEGLMLRKDDIYQGKRSNDLLKVKQFQTEEYVVQDVEFGDITVIDENTGLQKTIETLVSVVIHHEGTNTKTKKKDTKVINVGSGFSEKERIKYYENPDLIKGKTIAVQFFEYIRSKDGKESLRFPTFKGLYGQKRDV